MAINTTTIIGDVFLPSGAVREKSYVIFEMTGFDTDAPDGATVVPYPIRAAISAGGAISQALWPNADGVRATFYRVTFEIYNGTSAVLVDGGQIVVPTSGGPYVLNDLLPVAPPADADVDDYIAYLAAAVGTATTAASTASAAASTASAAASSASASASTATTKAAEASASAATVAASTAKLNQFAGRNLIINGSGRVNQRGYVSGTATTTANQFTLDRWFVVVSGQNLTFTGTNAGRIMTAPAGGVGQVVLAHNIEVGSYVMNWEGTATATINGTAYTKGANITLPANTNAVIKFFSGTFSKVQLEKGTLPTPYEWTKAMSEYRDCLVYFWKPDGEIVRAAAGYSTLGQPMPTLSLVFPETMVGIPTLVHSLGGGLNIGIPIISIKTTGFYVDVSMGTGGYATYSSTFTSASAEVTA